ncbi:NTP transferase domain-containing protein [Actinosynnema sp. NPDC020468]|uniref:molybdenum cofactor guanylyltransferase n=1 Tax=Actinosynnema sp. NPDC020468 TaxID=3154488 RepID=UPI0033DE22D6
MDGTWDAVVLAGGRGSRLGEVDKAAVVVGGTPLLARALAAVAGAGRVVVVGPRRPWVSAPRVVWAREEPPGGGPLAGLAAGLASVVADRVVVLAVDQPWVTAATVERLLAVGGDAVLVDERGRPQWLTGAWSVPRLRAALPADPAGASMRSLLGPLDATPVPAQGGEARDVDTPADLRDTP